MWTQESWALMATKTVRVLRIVQQIGTNREDVRTGAATRSLRLSEGRNQERRMRRKKLCHSVRENVLSNRKEYLIVSNASRKSNKMNSED